MIALRRSDGTVTASRKATEKIIHKYYSELFDSHVHLPSYEIKEDGQGVSAQCIKNLRELCKNFTTKKSPFYNDIDSDVKRGVRQGDTISSELLTVTLQNIMRTLEWDNLGVKIDGRQLNHLRFGYDIVLITLDISQAERILADFDKACGKIGLRLNLTETMFMKNGLVSFASFTLNGTIISVCSSYVYLGREINMMNDLAPELSKRKRASGLGSF
uniref:Reverse transcriptase domain-containing protein n=1 Tax=Angiostrongylus cantonensis TaxID=6313 RepID=A0A0K0DI56_ANGCA